MNKYFNQFLSFVFEHDVPIMIGCLLIAATLTGILIGLLYRRYDILQLHRRQNAYRKALETLNTYVEILGLQRELKLKITSESITDYIYWERRGKINVDTKNIIRRLRENALSIISPKATEDITDSSFKARSKHSLAKNQRTMETILNPAKVKKGDSTDAEIQDSDEDLALINELLENDDFDEPEFTDAEIKDSELNNVGIQFHDFRKPDEDELVEIEPDEKKVVTPKFLIKKT